MLLNRSLTIPRDKQARPKRHIRWWSPLAVAAMKAIRAEAETRPIAAMLWGVPSHGMRKYLEPGVEVFASSHPSPMSVQRSAGAERSFLGSIHLARSTAGSRAVPPTSSTGQSTTELTTRPGRNFSQGSGASQRRQTPTAITQLICFSGLVFDRRCGFGRENFVKLYLG